MSRASSALLGLSQWEGEKEGRSVGGARRMNAAAEIAKASARLEYVQVQLTRTSTLARQSFESQQALRTVSGFKIARAFRTFGANRYNRQRSSGP
jgi:hypothetical protein